MSLRRDGEPGAMRADLIALFMVSLFGLAFETFLTRYFAVALLSAYGYWVISIALLGYSFGGALLALLPDHFYRRRRRYLTAIPPFLLAAAVLSFRVLRIDAFNPLKLQNSALWAGQIPGILLFYLGLFPVFMLVGGYIGLSFLTYSRDTPKVYAMDLMGAALGCALVILAMFAVHPYHLPALMFPVLFGVVALNSVRYFRGGLIRRPVVILAGCLALLGAGTYAVLSVPVLAVPVFKGLHPILNIKGERIVSSRVSPSGFYVVASDYTELDDVSMTNNYDTLRIGSPPRSYGLYKDADRIGSVMARLPGDYSYIKGSLAYFPYSIRRNPKVLLIGTNGGLMLEERARSGISGGLALEQQQDVYSIVRDRLNRLDPGFERRSGLRFLRASMFSVLESAPRRFDIIEVSSDFLRQDETNQYSFTREAVELCLRSLRPGGILSIPVDISEFDVYCLKMAGTVAAALEGIGAPDPGSRVMLYRTAWTCRILASNAAFDAADVLSLRRFCNVRSFDTPYFPGIKPSEITIWNDLPPFSFQAGRMRTSSKAQDSIMNGVSALFQGSAAYPSEDRFFNLSPSTMDRPSFHSISRISRIRELLPRIEVLPEQEIGYLINLAVLAQAAVLAVPVLLLPLAAGWLRGRRRGRSLDPEAGLGPLRSQGRLLSAKTVLYFGSLGVGYFFVELALINRFSFFLESSTTSFGVTLACMLVFSGLGSWYADRFRGRPYQGVLRALPVIGLSLVAFIFALDPFMRAGIGWPMFLRLAAVIALTAPLSFAMGRPFPLGASALGGGSNALIPWAWAVNGALSVVAAPLANILSVSAGWKAIFGAALFLYAGTAFCFPLGKQRTAAVRREPLSQS